jgi:hypothetical protein
VRQIAERTGWSEEKAVRALREAVESCVANTLQMRTVVLETGCLDLDDFESYEGGDPRVLGGL